MAAEARGRLGHRHARDRQGIAPRHAGQRDRLGREADRHEVRRRGQCRGRLRRRRDRRPLPRREGRGRDRLDPKMADSRSRADVAFDGAAAEKLGGTDLTKAIADRAAAVTAAEMLGMAESAFHQTNDYLKQRVQFGQVLSTFQALQHRMAKMLTELELMRIPPRSRARWRRSTGRTDVDQAVSLAKAVAGDQLRLVAARWCSCMAASA
ncbi:acyl-CoA dehydrogenase family protein [Sphingomonas sp. MMS24-JH45]